ncbi:MAG: AI-2E family transporter [Steroidobacteraceae bacterium]
MTKREALGWLAIGALLLICWLARPFATGLLLGAVLAFTLEPAYAAFVRWTGRPAVASLITLLGSAALILGLVTGFVSLFVARAVVLARFVHDQLQPGGGIYVWVDSVSGWLARLGLSPNSVIERLEAGAGELASRSAAIAGSVASGTFGTLIELLFAFLAMDAVLRHWRQIVAAVAAVAPFESSHTQALLAEFRRMGRITVTGTVVTGLAQGLLAAIGYFITDVPQAVFFGICTAFASLVPAVGTLLVWIPIGIYLFLSGHPTRAIVELLWGALIIVGLSDYVIRPRLSSDSAMPAVLVFIALFGGLEAFGLSGLIVGPVVMSLAVAVLRIYAREQKSAKS